MSKALLVVALALGAACGSGGAARRGPDDARPIRRSANVVLADEIHRQGGQDLYAILRALRPAWFNVAPTRMTRGAVVVDPIVVYVDGFRTGTPRTLSDVPVSTVVQVRFYSASEAQGRFGLGNLQGAIEVTTSR